MKRALCTGINDYPGVANDLKGCVNDANDWADLLKNVFGFENVETVTDSEVTKGKIIGTEAAPGKLRQIISEAKNDDVIVFTYSGHGTWKADTNGDESDGRDEALCFYDDIVLDDDIRKIIDGMAEGVRFTFISDSCHSGTVTRHMLESRADNPLENSDHEYAPRQKFMPPDMAAEIYNRSIEEFQVTNLFSFFAPLINGFFSLFSGRPEILLSGCKDSEYSYDAYINGRYNGAMTAVATTLMEQNPSATYEEFYRELRKILPSQRYSQSPQMGGNKEIRRRKLFS